MSKVETTTEHTAKVRVRQSDRIVVTSGSALGEYIVHASSASSVDHAIRQIREFGEAIVAAVSETKPLSMDEYRRAVHRGDIDALGIEILPEDAPE